MCRPWKTTEQGKTEKSSRPLRPPPGFLQPIATLEVLDFEAVGDLALVQEVVQIAASSPLCLVPP
jgi:hypothetical protein